jgi:hypothetical protein
LGSRGSTVTAPIDWPWASNTGLKVVPPSDDFQTPPPAAPTQRVGGGPGEASRAAMRPLITAGPRARASRPAKVAESTSTVAAVAGAAGGAS